MSFNIIPIKASHIKEVVEVHMEAFPNFFLTFLGPKFLGEFYKSFTCDPDGIGFVAQDSKTHEVLGVIVGPLIPQGYFKRLLIKRWWAFCSASVWAVLKKPVIVGRLFRAVFYRGDASPGDSKRSLLSSIAVDPKRQGSHIGRTLVAAWLDEVKKRGGCGVYLTTDAKNNDIVNNFYKRIGWKLESTYLTPQGRAMNRYVLDF